MVAFIVAQGGLARPRRLDTHSGKEPPVDGDVVDAGVGDDGRGGENASFPIWKSNCPSDRA
eukprot:3786008-Pyramimonas_sp.AAC.1